jgi:hypothetical protein
MEKHLDVTASEKRQEKVGFEGLNQRVTDLNAFVKELRGENKELQGQIEQAKKALREEMTKKDKEVELKVERLTKEHKREKSAIIENHQKLVD